MNENSNFDKQGFLFFLKFAIFVFVFLGLARYSPQILLAPFLENQSQNVAQINQQIDEIISQREVKQLALAEQAEIKRKNKITLGFVGDIMMSRNIELNIAENSKGDFTYHFDLIKDHLEKYDALFGNLEGPISNRGSDRGSIYSFRMNPVVASALKSVGFDVLSVANNHIGDWGGDAMEDTFKYLFQHRIVCSGGGLNEREAYSHKIITVKGLRIAFLSFSQFGKGYLEAKNENPGIAIIASDRLEVSVKKAKKDSDIVIVSFHFGDEYTTEPNAYQRKISEQAIDYGADLVVGHHPHTVQPVERYKNGYIAFSLGNFIFDQNFCAKTSRGLILKVIVEDKKISQVDGLAVGFTTSFQPFLVQDNQ